MAKKVKRIRPPIVEKVEKVEEVDPKFKVNLYDTTNFLKLNVNFDSTILGIIQKGREVSISVEENSQLIKIKSYMVKGKRDSHPDLKVSLNFTSFLTFLEYLEKAPDLINKFDKISKKLKKDTADANLCV